MSSDELERFGEVPLLYYRTENEIEAYAKKPVKQKLQWLQAQMEFFHKAMPDKSKTIRDRLFRR
ncbi:MAG: hypothetical protein H6Q55_1631 [Deltaproteobacteria bacterium]|jgi:hypothetical protein|nr:hypothetical protein [Deltaproteobacteria bacterium]